MPKKNEYGWTREQLKQFGVFRSPKERQELHDALIGLGRSGRADVQIESVARRYAYLAIVRPTGCEQVVKAVTAAETPSR